MKTAREFANEFKRPGVDGQQRLDTADVEARDREIRVATLRAVADRLWARTEERMDSDEYMGIGAAANLVEIMISEAGGECER